MRRPALALAVALAAVLTGPSATAPAATSGPPDTWRVVSAGTAHTCGVRTDLTLWCWGSGEDGVLGTGSTASSSRPVRIGEPGGWDTVRAGESHTCALRRDGSLWCWGSMEHLALGVAGAPRRLVPTRVGDGRSWKELTVGRTLSCALRRDRTLWCWGSSRSGALGHGPYMPTVEGPEQVGTEHSWTSVSAGRDHVCGTRTDRSLWCWGAAGSGQLGVGDREPRFEPARVGTARDWTGVTAGAFHTCAIRSIGSRTDRTVWCWGRDRQGELGLGEPSPRLQLAPARVAGARSYLRVAAGGGQTCAARANETLWCWGAAELVGVPGTADRTRRTQVEIPGATGRFRKLAAGPEHTCAVDGARRLWCWGSAGQGRLGLGGGTDRAVPTRVP